MLQYSVLVSGPEPAQPAPMAYKTVAVTRTRDLARIRRRMYMCTCTIALKAAPFCAGHAQGRSETPIFIILIQTRA